MRRATVILGAAVAVAVGAVACASPAAPGPSQADEPDAPAPEAGAGRFEPARDFERAPDLRSSRERFSVIRLADGRVMAVGGRARGLGNVEAGNFNGTAELMDPSTLEWTLTGELAHKRRSPALVQLADRRVLAAGGTGAQKVPIASVEIWDPAGGAWTAGADMLAARDSMGTAALRDGRVLVVGGVGIDERGYLITSLADVEIFDPRTGAWTAAAPMSEARVNHTATALRDGRVLAVGGGGVDGPYSNTAEIYDPGADAWTAASSMSVGRAFHTATLLADGRVLVVGGKGKRTLAEVYDPAADAWSAAGETELPRAEHAATLLADGRVLVTGGVGHLAPSEVFEPESLSWTTVGSLRTGRYRHGAARLTDGRIVVMGGTGGDGILASAEVLTSVGSSLPAGSGGAGEGATPRPEPTPTSEPTPEPTPTPRPEVDAAALTFADPVDAEPGPDATSVDLATPVRLRPGQEIFSPKGPGGLIVEFMEVVEDTRCPPGEACPDPGRAVIRVKLRVPSGPLGESEIELAGGQAQPAVRSFGRYSVAFISLEPVPAGGAGEAVATLAVVQPGR